MKKWITTYFLKNYFIRRLLPFYGIALMIEFIQKIYLLITYPHLFDWRFFTLSKTFLTALVETSVSFLYMALFLMLYFIAMPVQKQNKRFDRQITPVLFFIFIFINFLEDFIEISLFQYTQSSFNKTSLEQILTLPSVFFAHYFILSLILTVTLLSFLITKLWRSYLFSRIKAPVLQARLLTFCLLCLLSLLIYFTYHPNMNNVSDNPYNNKLSKDGFYTLFKELHEIDHLFHIQ